MSYIESVAREVAMKREVAPEPSAAPAGEATRAEGFPGSPRLDGLIAEDMGSWESFRRSLRPRYGVAWRELAAYAACAVGVLIAHAAIAIVAGNGVAMLLVLPAALWVGYWICAVVSFMHEAAHFNLHRDKTVNDRLADRLICPLAFEQISHYRAVHWQHHLHLGDVNDTEVSYHRAPTARFVIEALTGIQVLRVLGRQQTMIDETTAGAPPPARTRGVLRGAAVHGGIVAAAVAVGAYSTAVVWVLGAAVFYPFCTAMRQVLEHRSAQATPGTDYRRVAHGPVNRLFGCDRFARTFGAAGFNRHLLHHWYPAASYTCFDEIERFLMRTSLAPQLNAARTTYWATWRQLARATP
jgi:fatty acid desaturase